VGSGDEDSAIDLVNLQQPHRQQRACTVADHDCPLIRAELVPDKRNPFRLMADVWIRKVDSLALVTLLPQLLSQPAVPCFVKCSQSV
jgi:hypothetical protein